MNQHRFLIKLGLAFIALFIAFWFWQAPGIITGKLTPAEIDHHIALAEKQLAFPADGKDRIFKRLRTWAEADDGKPFYMLNLMRLYGKINQFPGTPGFDGTPAESNQLYESIAGPMLLKNAGSMPYGGNTQSQAIFPIGTDPAFDDWSRVLVVRYPNRRAFLQLVSNPDYAKIAPYKLMALEVLLVPTSAELVVPDLRAILGAALLVIFLLTGWVRAARRPR